MEDHINLVSCQHFFSGIGRYSFELGEEMYKSSAIQLFKPSKPSNADHFYEDQYDWIKGYFYKSFRNLHPYVLPLFIKQALNKTFDSNKIYHAHWFLSGLALSYFKNAKFVVTMHDVSLLHIHEGDQWFMKYYKWAINRFKERRVPIIVVSESAKKDTILHAKYPEELVHVIHNGINFDQFYPSKTIERSENEFNIIYTGGLGERKNLQLLLRAFQAIEKKYPFVKLRIAGMYPERTVYPKIAEALELKNVIFEGYIPDEKLIDFYHKGDLLVFPSLYEGFGFAPLEAMASSVPVLSAKGGSLREVVGEGGDFFDYDVDDLQLKISNIIDDESYRQDLIKRGSLWVKKFTWEESVRKTKEVYKSVS
ncbi:glycosyltransferase family 4 protein [Flammeovirga aprica]|uniref:Glycosyltransferase family 4 protein n=1 Tax=Flammeovirga aprica JL-4 TaxID=694437 RepID=A0A7X9RUA5_9BACT|nr:glycosyltransferase family 1 protein [Flammeovirga aprica]NME68838.1 glycosyltransferase family 4 protein [Flammeovirga aprica JL-4]